MICYCVLLPSNIRAEQIFCLARFFCQGGAEEIIAVRRSAPRRRVGYDFVFPARLEATAKGRFAAKRHADRKSPIERRSEKSCTIQKFYQRRCIAPKHEDQIRGIRRDADFLRLEGRGRDGDV